MENGKFNINKFNQIYSENRLNTVMMLDMEIGYHRQKWMMTTEPKIYFLTNLI